jgi:hypothetical protein
MAVQFALNLANAILATTVKLLDTQALQDDGWNYGVKRVRIN